MLDVVQWVFLILNIAAAAHGLALGSTWVLNALAATFLAVAIDMRGRSRVQAKKVRELGGKR